MEEKAWLFNLRNAKQIEEHIQTWQDSCDRTLGYILSMEGTDPILSPEGAVKWWQDGLRVVGLSHYGMGVYAEGTSHGQGIPAVDGCVPWPVLASHNSCRSLVLGDRQFSDEQVRALIDRGAVIGAVLDSWMLWPGDVPGKSVNDQIGGRPH